MFYRNTSICSIPFDNCFFFTRMYISQSLWIYVCISNVCVAMAVGFLMVIFFEAPIMHIEKLTFGYLGLAKLPSPIKYKIQ